MVRPANLENVTFTGLRGRVAAFVEHPRFVSFIAGLIILNAAILGIETYPRIDEQYGKILHTLDFVILIIFVIEICLKLYLYRASFFRDGWNVFDFIIIGGSLVSVGAAVTVLRTLRIFRVLRIMSIVPSMRRVISALFSAVPGMASIMGIMAIIFYIAAVVATTVFGAHPDPQMQSLFGSLQRSMYTLFQVMTLEDWPDIAQPTIALFPWAWLYFVLFIIVTSFAVLNLFVGIIVDAMDIVHDFEEEGKGVKDFVAAETEGLRNEIDTLRSDLSEIKSLLKK